MFDAQTLAIQNIQSQVDGSDSAKRELVPAERSVRIADQKTRLAGYDLTGPLECSFASYDLCVELQEKDAEYYLAPHKFTTRSSEVVKDKPSKELVLDANSLKINDTKNRDPIAISNELELSQAFTRRALGCDVVGIVSFQRMEKWHRYLFQQMAHSPPPGYMKPTLSRFSELIVQAGFAWQKKWIPSKKMKLEIFLWIKLSMTCRLTPLSPFTFYHYQVKVKETIPPMIQTKSSKIPRSKWRRSKVKVRCRKTS